MLEIKKKGEEEEEEEEETLLISHWQGQIFTSAGDLRVQDFKVGRFNSGNKLHGYISVSECVYTEKREKIQTRSFVSSYAVGKTQREGRDPISDDAACYSHVDFCFFLSLFRWLLLLLLLPFAVNSTHA